MNDKGSLKEAGDSFVTDILYLFGTKFIFRVYEGKVGNFLKCTFGYYMHELEHPMQTPFWLATQSLFPATKNAYV